MAYLLDSDTFIRAKRLHYGFDFCPGYWDWLVTAYSDGRVLSIERVRNELLAGQDELSEWVRQQGPGFFKPPDISTLPAFGQVAEWLSEQRYTVSAIRTFTQVADYSLVAEALAGHHTIVTHEVPSNSTRRIKIPDVCIGLDIGCITPFDMLRREQARFVLGVVT